MSIRPKTDVRNSPPFFGLSTKDCHPTDRIKTKTQEIRGDLARGIFRGALRAKTHDIDIFEQIFLLRDCEVKRAEPHFIVDPGAHIGCSALFFVSSFPSDLDWMNRTHAIMIE